ncbi:ABC transporter ATP-binding protein [bacterium]|nr:ABC transporter ATP-binding protein [bacterium]
MAKTLPLIKTKGLTKVYRQGKRLVRALRGIDLEIKAGEFVAIMGPSGSGKSTFLYLLGMLDRPTKGRYWLEGEEVSKLNENQRAFLRNQKIGFVFQTFNLLPRANAIEHLLIPTLYGPSPNAPFAKAKALLKKVGLEKRMFHYPNELSGGEQQRVAIARALINDPDLILADEPTGNLDSRSGKQIMALFAQLNKEGRTIVVVTHDPHIARYASRRVYLKDGKIVSRL